MTQAATITPSQMTRIFLSMPQYHFYGHDKTAVKHEHVFRLSLAQMLQEIAERLLNTSELRGTSMSEDRHAAISGAVEDIGTLISHLNRRGRVGIVGSLTETIDELRDLDNKLIMLLEQTWHMSMVVLKPECPAERFEEGSHYLSLMLRAFADTAEERNRLLGLGWESEFGMSPMPGRD